MKRTKGVNKFKRSRKSYDSIEVIEDFSKELEALIQDEQLEGSDLEGFSDLSGEEEPALTDVVDESLFDRDFDSEEDDEDVGKREFVAAQLDQSEESCESEASDEEMPSTSMLTMEEIESLRQNLTAKFDLKLVSKAVETLKESLETMGASLSRDPSKHRLDPFESLIQFVLGDLVVLIDQELQAVDYVQDIAKAPKWKKFSKLAEKILKLILRLLQTVLASSSAIIVVGCINQWLPYLRPFTKLTNEFATALMDIWCGVVCSNFDDERLKVATIVVLCKICQSNEVVLSNVLKGSYLRFAKCAKAITTHNIAVVNFMLNSMLELYRLNPKLSYHYGFLFIRQLALSVRCLYSTGIAGDAREKQVKKVISWQFLYCLKFWAKFVSQQGKLEDSQTETDAKDIVSQLVYPVVQICVCVLNVGQKSKQQYFPYFIHIIRLLNEIAIGRNVFVVTFNYAFGIIETMNSNHTLTKSDTLKPADLSTTIKVAKGYVNSRIYFDSLLEECAAVILEGLAIPCLAEAPAFVEHGEIVRSKLAKCIKAAKNPKVSTFLRDVVQVIKENQTFVQEKRNGSDDKRHRSGKSPLLTYWGNFQRTIEHKKKMQYEAAKEK